MKKWLSLLLLVMFAPAVAQADIVFEGWGPRLGLSVDPDQFHIGVHVNLGEFVPNLRFQPNAELGFGDHIFLLLISGETFYLFDVRNANFRPYAGGELSLAYWRVDTRHGDDDDLELGLSPVGGFELPFSDRIMGFVELKLGIADVPDFRVTVGIYF